MAPAANSAQTCPVLMTSFAERWELSAKSFPFPQISVNNNFVLVHLASIPSLTIPCCPQLGRLKSQALNFLASLITCGNHVTCPGQWTYCSGRRDKRYFWALVTPPRCVFLTLNLDVMHEYRDSLWQLLNTKEKELHAKRVKRENRNSLEINHGYSFNDTVNDCFSRSP